MGQDPKPKESNEGSVKVIAAGIREDRMKEAIKFYKKRGTMVPLVETFRELSDKEKAEFLDDAMVRAKGAPSKKNPFKE